MREALAHPDLSFFQTDRLFAPYGLNLTLYTHTALPAFIGATMLQWLTPVAAQNVLILASLSVNGVAAYLLAYDRSHDRGAAMVGGLLFAGSPYISAHLLGHFNLIAAWGLPLFLLCFERALEQRSIKAAVGGALVAVAVAYTDYYYLVYCAVLAGGLILWDLRPMVLVIRQQPLGIRTQRLLVSLLALDALIVALILVAGGFDTTIATIRIRSSGPTNPLAFGWLILAVWVLLRYRPSLSLRAVPLSAMSRHLRLWAPLAAVTIVGMMPLIAGAWSLWRSGTYVAPRASWRSGPGGVDLATLFLGNPLHPWSGMWTRGLYRQFDINQIESVAWIGIAPVALTWWAAVRHRGNPAVGRWLLIAALAFLWALGPWLRIAGFNTGLLLPQNLLAHVPILSNARIPGRALSIVFLSLGVAIAVALTHLPPKRRRYVVAAVLVLVTVDFLPAPFPLTGMTVPSFVDALRDRRDGRVVCELPVGARDGFGSFGQFDDHALLDATIHEHPIVGGSTSRLPPAVVDGYRTMPVMRSLFRLSAGESADPADVGLSRQDTSAALQAVNVGYLVLNRTTASPELVGYVEDKISVELVGIDGPHWLYAVVR